jgi:hypothetical protein
MFELAAQSRRGDLVSHFPSGKSKVEAVCSWHGVIPPTTYPNLDITNAGWEILSNYSGDVADNIGE